MKYYDVHVFYERDEGFSAFLATNRKLTSDEEIIAEAVTQKILDSEDAKSVNNVEEITEEEYKRATF